MILRTVTDISEQWAAYISGVTNRVQKGKPKMAEIDVQCQSLSFVFICAVKHKRCKECAEILWFDFDLNNNTVIYKLINRLARGFGGAVVSALAFHLWGCGFDSRWELSQRSSNPVLYSCEKSQSTLCRKSWVFSGHSGFLPQGSWQGGLG